MLAKTVEMARWCSLLSGVNLISKRAFSRVHSNRVANTSMLNIVRAKPTIQLPVSGSTSVLTWNRKKSCSFTTRATGDSAPFDSPLIDSMRLKIKEQLSAESVTVTDAYGDGRHVSISVVSAEFEGKSEVNRQRMVYKAIWEELQNTVHAVDHMTTKTPQEAAAGNS